MSVLPNVLGDIGPHSLHGLYDVRLGWSIYVDIRDYVLGKAQPIPNIRTRENAALSE